MIISLLTIPSSLVSYYSTLYDLSSWYSISNL